MKRPFATNSRRAGLTIVEMMVTAGLMFLVLGALAQSVAGMRDATSTEDAKAMLQTNGEKALRTVVDELRRSAFVQVAGTDYPLLFDDGVPPAGSEQHAHAPATKTAAASDADFGPNREIVLRVPADADDDGRPDIDGNGNVVWDAGEVSFVVVTDPNGVNVLQRRVDGAGPRTVTRFVERIAFDDNTSSNFVVPLNSIRVRIDLRKPNAAGLVIRHSVETTVRLRNG